VAIFGIGTDIVKLERVERSFLRHGEKFVKRILAGSEIEQFQSKGSDNAKVAFLAKRFAAKEAISKALGTGMREGIDFKQLIVKTNALGKPEVCLEGKAKLWASKCHIINVHLSLSDERDAALAFAIAEIE
jgi:holo-[acyl-carrier protein] synthase